MIPLNRLCAAELAPRLARRELTAESLVRACLERIEAREPEVQAWAFLDPEIALAQARALDHGAVRGMLHGLPVGVKDIFDTHDMPTGYGSPIYAGRRPGADSAAVALTRRAGGLVLGKTVTTEFATPTPSRTRNPHNSAHTPGVSSSGSAAAVADFMVPLAFGTQTGGSLIRPGAYCGAVAYKPTYNTIPRAGVKANADSLDTVGVFSRSVADAALYAAALTGRADWLIASALGSPPRIGLCRPAAWGRIETPMDDALEAAAKTFAAAGGRIEEIALPASFTGLRDAFGTIAWYEMARSLADEFARFPERLGDALRAICAEGFALDPARYDAAVALARDCRECFAGAIGTCDVLLVPGATGEAPLGLASIGDNSMNVVWTLLHVPAITFPGGTGPMGLPLGLQVVGRIGDDKRVLACADWMAPRASR